MVENLGFQTQLVGLGWDSVDVGVAAVPGFGFVGSGSSDVLVSL